MRAKRVQLRPHGANNEHVHLTRIAWFLLVTVVVVQVRVEDGEWVAWSDSVPKTQLEPHRIVSSDVVITTTDTVR